MTDLVVLNAYCTGHTDGLRCNYDLTRFVLDAIGGQAMPAVIVRCPNCHQRITVKLPWRTTAIVDRPVLLPEKGG